MTQGAAQAVSAALLEACRVDVQAFKPGNVSLASGGHGMQAADFILSAQAAAGWIARPGLSVGERILRAIEATRAVVPYNTNLGIVLLAAPLAHAALEHSPHAGRIDLRTRLRATLAALDTRDAQQAYAAIRLARPGGLGESAQHDVRDTPQVTLREAMRAAAQRDRVAYQFDTDYADIFEFGLAHLRRFVARWHSIEWAAVALYLEFLARQPDSHVARKFGLETAHKLSAEAAQAAQALAHAEQPQSTLGMLETLDRKWKESGINPGTSADLTVAALFALALEDWRGSVTIGDRAARGAACPDTQQQQ